MIARRQEETTEKKRVFEMTEGVKIEEESEIKE